MEILKWYSIENFAREIGDPNPCVRALKKATMLRDRLYVTEKTPRSVKNLLFILRLLCKHRVNRTLLVVLRQEIRELKWELGRTKASLSLARDAITFYKETSWVEVEFPKENSKD
ncbi:hypothetical protein EHO61_07660 [Leptospira fluminis]|uniref:Uncharacterized protein n=1 Tax=Leptospira fluminis TaxID=2484979 RepID=A0A4R9GQ33_9LEPT|nr:hypothetical protein [Leptospira fluminis]TGK19339.1 hypothetical protein EHO61_07660 [Leptospira fluminis]